ncbi:MAG: DUF481 domain-containing protein [Bacteroidetes bacterium]|nr:DUF481 domain-containing protein [Bacteroidota bacterium]MBP7399844.1 DUF481 domain-containing protein [Chitinophagales bacterium]MBK8488294.1 DUF481 domain-containing protein [Bacteroidota bacterium]MBP8754695.1 DUF481 domain-containing protein [Chitinophagales bacterium]MBP9188791.1 DUF481 domain-containing protein [Chitinophagales bacterium]
MRILLCFCFFTGLFFSHLNTCLAQDVLYLFNGDIYNGKVIHVEAARLRFDGKKTGIINIKLKDIKSIKSDVNAISMELLNSESYYGWLDTLAPPGYSRFYNLDDTFAIRIDSISQLTSIRTSFFNRFRGSITAGMSYTKANNYLSGNGNVDLTYYARNYFISNKFSANGSNNDGDYITERASNNLTGLYEANKHINYIAMFTFYKSVELGLDHRYTLGFGVGNYLYKSRIQNLQAYVLINALKEKDLEGTVSDFLMQYPVGLSYNLYLYNKHTLQLSIDNVFTTIPSQSWRMRFDQNITFRYELIKDLYLSLSGYLNYDSDPSSAATSKTDYGINTGVSISF